MRWIPTAIAIAVGLITLLTFFFELPVLGAIGAAFKEWTIILTAFALILGLGNLLLVHFLRIIRRNESGVGYSLLVLITAGIVFAIGLIFGVTDGPMLWVFNNIYLPLQGAFFALTAFFLATAAYRAMRVRSFATLLMFIAALIVFVGQTPLLNFLGDAKEWILAVPSTAGVRGIMLGVAIGVIATGIRVLIGMDRPYSE